jgi:hypothetical protein
MRLSLGTLACLTLAALPSTLAPEVEARRLGLWGQGVARLPQWVPYAARGPLLRAAAVAVCRTAAATGGDKPRIGRAARPDRPPPSHTACR